jgi:uncharacterized protein (DUF342 family)
MAGRTGRGTGEPIMVSGLEMERLQGRLKTVEEKLKELEQILSRLKRRKKEAKKK